MRRLHGFALAAVLALAPWVLLLTSGSARAAADSTTPTVDIQLFQPTAGGTGFFTTESGEVNSHLSLSVGFNANYARNPLNIRILRADNTSDDVGAVVQNRIDANLLMAFGLFNLVELGVAVPLISQGGFEGSKFTTAAVDIGIDKLDAFTVGDIRLIPKIKAIDIAEGAFALSLVPTVIVPTAGGKAFAGEAGVVMAPSLAMSSRGKILRGGLNLGYRVRPRTEIKTFTLDDEYFVKAALAVDLFMGTKEQPLELIAEVFGATPVDRPFGSGISDPQEKDFEKARTPFELSVGVRATLLDHVLVTLGGGGGLTPGYGAPVPRVFLGVLFYTGAAGPPDGDKDGVADELDKCLDKPEDKDGFEDEDGCPDLDNDNDRVLDEDDQCPIEAEDRDGFADEDGCPEKDNDEDGFLDADDKCPSDAEDKDGHQDDDGCPDLDNDGDKIADTVDQCPAEKEDPDGYQDTDGCPEPDNDGDGLTDINDLCPNHAEDQDGVADDDGCPEDNDGDGIADTDDKCPGEAETYNGIEDEDGCPEKLKAKSLVNVTSEKIEIKETVFFKSGSAVIQPRSFKLLDQVAAVLKNYKIIRKLNVEGHTDSQGNRLKNKRLSQDRAESVVNYLISKGVEPERLAAIGVGPDRPIASNKTKRGRDENRRVEFVIAEQGQYGKDVAEPAVEIDVGGAPATPAPGEGGFDIELESPAPPPAPAGPPAQAPSPPAPQKGEPEVEIELNF